MVHDLDAASTIRILIVRAHRAVQTVLDVVENRTRVKGKAVCVLRIWYRRHPVLTKQQVVCSNNHVRFTWVQRLAIQHCIAYTSLALYLYQRRIVLVEHHGRWNVLAHGIREARGHLKKPHTVLRRRRRANFQHV